MNLSSFKKTAGILFCFGLTSLCFPLQTLAFISKEGGFSVWMPGEPRLERVNHKSFAGNVVENTYTFKTESEEYSVSYSQLPDIALSLESTKALLIKAKEGFLKEAHAQEISFEKIAFVQKEARELTFQIIHPNHVKDATGKARFFLVDKKMYVVMTLNIYDDKENMTHFLNSFRLLNLLSKSFFPFTSPTISFYKK